MFSKEEAKKIKQEFWTAFGKSFPRKWILYNTKIKDFSFKFSADSKKAEVSLELQMNPESLRTAYYHKIWSLEDTLKEYIGVFFKSETYQLDNGKSIARIWVPLDGVSIFNKKNWPQIFEFFVEKMDGFESFFWEYEDFIRDVSIPE